MYVSLEGLLGHDFEEDLCIFCFVLQQVTMATRILHGMALF
jgi:hypothetical protein